MPVGIKASATGAQFETLQPRVLLASDPMLAVGQITSSSVTIGWDTIPDAQEIRVYLAAEPSQTPGADLPGQVLIDTLPGTTTSYTVANLAAEVDAFFRVEATLPGEEVGSNIHARTVGGPNSGTDDRMYELDTPLRSIHGFAPNVLELVLAEFEIEGSSQASASDNDGITWQYGEWSITRADGTPIEVVEVHRRSVPTGVWKMDLNPADPSVDDYGSTRIVDADHHIYLVLDENIGSREILTIEGPKALEFVLPFSDKYLETTVIQLNQVGYNPDATERYAYVSGWMGDGGGLDLSNFPNLANVLVQPTDALAQRSAAVRFLPITERSAFDSYSGSPVDEIDLSVVPAAEGVRYRVQIPGVGVSWATAVSEEAAFKAYHTIARGLYFQRWGDELDEEYTEFVRGLSHVTRPGEPNLDENPNRTYPTVYKSDMQWTGGTQFFSRNTPRTNPIEIRGGHHDAADHDLRSYHTTIPQTLMRAYELNTGAHMDGQLHIPQSGNGIPDILDEALWNIQSWEALQESNGGVRAGVESYGHPSHGYRTEDRAPYWTYGVDTWTTAKAAGIFAQAARLVQPFDADRSAELLDRAIAAYNYVKNVNGNIRWRLYGASELYALTGQQVYKNDFESYWSQINNGSTGAFSGITFNQGQSASHMPDHLLGYLTSDNADPNRIAIGKSVTSSRAATVVGNLYDNHAHRTPGNASGWGSSTSLGREMDTIYARLQLGGLTPAEEQAYFNALSLAADFILGGNAMGMSWITGLGSRYPRAITHHDAQSFIKDGMGLMPGIPVYGVVQAINPNSGSANQYPARVFYPAPSELPAYRRYGDSWTMIATSEFTVSESMAPHIQLFATLLPEGLTLPESYKPYQSEHRNTITASGNKAAVVDAGEQRVVNLSGSSVNVNLSGSVTDDGVTAGVETIWRLAKGPAGVTFSNASALQTTATFTRAGEYVLHLVADDGELLGFDELRIIVNSTGAQAPAVNAGAGYHVALPETQVTLDGTVSGSGTLTTWWSVDSTPAGGRVIFDDASAIDTTATLNVPGTYTLRLHADNGTRHTSDTVQFVVRPEGSLIWANANVVDSKTLALYHFDETSGTRADNAQGASNRDLIMSNSGVWQPTNAWGGDGGHISARQASGSMSGTPIPTDWSNGMTLSFWMRANIDPGGNPPVKLQHTASWSNEMGLMWIYGNLESTAIARDTYAYLKNLALQDPTRTLSYEELTDGQWHHYAIVYMGDQSGMARLYVDNILQEVNANGATEWAATSSSIADTGRLLINRFNGEIDEVLLQNEALTDFSNGHDASKNFAPWVHTGNDRVIDGLNTSLKAWVTDDGFTGQLSTSWSKVSGPGNVTFGNPSNPNTPVSFSTTGTYVLRLTANDGSLTGYDEVRINVRNQAPTVFAGNDLSANLPAAATLNGSASDNDGPEPVTTTWSQVSGPGTAMFADKNDPKTTVTFSQPGTYILRLTADDGDKLRHDDVTVTAGSGWLPIGDYATDFITNVQGHFQYAQVGRIGSNTGANVTANWGAGHLLVNTRNNQQYAVALRTGDDGDGVSDNNNGYFTGDTTAQLLWEYVNGDSSNVRTLLSVRQATNSGANNYPVYYAAVENNSLTIYKRVSQDVQYALATQWFNQTGGDSTYMLQLSATDGNGEVGLSARLYKDGLSIAMVDTTDTSNVLTAGYVGFAIGSSASNNTMRGGRITGFAINPQSDANLPPVVVAGANQQIQLPEVATLSGSVYDDGKPNPPGAVTTLWTVASGPGDVVFANPTALNTTASFSEPGIYVLRLTADDGERAGFGDVTINVAPAASAATYSTDFSVNRSSHFRFAQIGGTGSNTGSNVTTNWNGGDLDIITTYNLQHTLALIRSDDGDGIQDTNNGFYTGDVIAELKWQYTDGDSSNVRTLLSVRQSSSSGNNNYPVYFASIHNNTLTIYKRTTFTNETAIASQSFSPVGGSSTYTLRLSATDVGNTVQLAAAFYQDGSQIAAVSTTDTSNVITSGYIGFGMGSADNGTRGARIIGFQVMPGGATGGGTPTGQLVSTTPDPVGGAPLPEQVNVPAAPVLPTPQPTPIQVPESQTDPVATPVTPVTSAPLTPTPVTPTPVLTPTVLTPTVFSSPAPLRHLTVEPPASYYANRALFAAKTPTTMAAPAPAVASAQPSQPSARLATLFNVSKPISSLLTAKPRLSVQPALFNLSEELH